MSNNQEPSSSHVPSSEKDMPYKFTGLQDPALRSPGAPLPGHQFKSNAAAERAAAAASWQGEQDYQQRRNDAQARKDAAPPPRQNKPTRKRGK